jgi:plasmid stabilization system protein ParE
MERSQIIWQGKAKRSIRCIAKYISTDKPESAVKFVNSIVEFGNNLGSFHSYALCRHKEYVDKGLGCINFAKNYIFLYRVTPTKLYIVDIIHASRLR